MSQHIELPLARAAIDRDAAFRKDPDLFDHLWENPKTRVIVLLEGKTLLEAGSQSGPKLKFFEVADVPSAQLRAYLGKTLEFENNLEADSPIVLAVVSKNSADQIEADPDQWHTLRNTGFGLSARDAGIFTQALALSNWHESHKYCPRCGMPTTVQEGGWSRRCFSDGNQIFPRTDPAIIVSVIDRHDRILLGSQGSWSENRYSILAGFVEAGESLPHAVIREVFEESGIRVKNPKYLASQAWPFPASLMVGFTAEVDESFGEPTLTPDGEEIVRLKWYSRQEILADVAASKLVLPSRLSISRALIEEWFGGVILDLGESLDESASS
ncbi:MAG: hypothetical protein RL556_608 [Actinomycetota bacterium]